MSRTWLLAVAVSALAGCGHAEAQPVHFDLDQPFTLGGGQEATIRGENLLVRFTDVLEDSRCPKAVECFWTGQARVAVDVQPDGGEPTTVQFNTNPAPGQNVQVATVNGYAVALRALDPFPQTPDESIELEDYRVTLLVAKG